MRFRRALTVKRKLLGAKLLILLLFATIIYNSTNKIQSPCGKAKWSPMIRNTSEHSSSLNSKHLNNLSPPGVILEFRGRLGNQLFQYACSYALSKRLGVKLYHKVPEVLARKLKSREKYDIEHFNITFDNIINADTKYSSKDVFNFNDSQLLLKELPTDNRKLLMHIDFCQSERFFEPYGPDLREMYQMKLETLKPIQHWVDEIYKVGNGSVAVHVRRGDFLNASGFETPISYQKKAIKLMSEKLSEEPNVTFFVFSDDIQYTKKKLSIIPNTIFVSSKKTSNLEDFYLMTKCRHMIVANSTFSWWAAYLIQNLKKIIIGPKFRPEYFDHYKLPYVRDFKRFVVNNYWYPPSWTIIDFE